MVSSPEELLTTPVHEIFSRFEMLDEHGKAFDVERLPGRLALQGQTSPECLICVRPRQGGGEYWSLVKATPLLDAQGRVQYVINIWHDVTELRRAVRARDEFLSVASHEMRSPIMALQLVSELILQRARAELADAPAWLFERLGDLVTQVQRVGSLIDSLLDVTRLSEGKLTLELSDVDLVAVARESVARYGSEAARAGSVISLSAPARVVGRWDRLRLEQIVSNLLQNAIRYGSSHPIEVAIFADDGEAHMVVRDRGIGIDPTDQRRIFERFERAVSPHLGGGLGIGLWIVREIVDALGGAIEVTSQPSRGAAFTVVLPLRGPTG
jgi:two-component system, OmpR family, sensor kinase